MHDHSAGLPRHMASAKVYLAESNDREQETIKKEKAEDNTELPPTKQWLHTLAKTMVISMQCQKEGRKGRARDTGLVGIVESWAPPPGVPGTNWKGVSQCSQR